MVAMGRQVCGRLWSKLMVDSQLCSVGPPCFTVYYIQPLYMEQRKVFCLVDVRVCSCVCICVCMCEHMHAFMYARVQKSEENFSGICFLLLW